MSEKFLTKSAFAALQGWSPSYVTKLKDQGRLVFCPNNAKLVDVDATLADLLCTGDPRKASLREHHAAERVRKHVTAHIRPDAPEDEIPAAASPKYWESKARRENSLAALTLIELDKTRNALVERERVEAMADAAWRKLSDAVFAVPAQLAPELATMSDAFQIEVRLRDALRQVLSDMSKLTCTDV